MRRQILLSIAAAALLASCGEEAPQSGETANTPTGDQATPAEEQTADITALIDAAISNPARPKADVTDDADRNPAAVLAFAGVKPGMTVYEMEAGSGYYTELLSFLVGPDGAVTMQNPPSFDSFLDDAAPNRLAGDRLANVTYDKVNFDELTADDASVDVVTWFLGPHELYFAPSEGVTLGEVGPTYAEIVRVLKPGGIFVVLDHAAAPGSEVTTGGTLHRIDPDIIRRLATDAGFVLTAESDVLRNLDDNYAASVFDPAVRRKTDRFLIKFQKPE